MAPSRAAATQTNTLTSTALPAASATAAVPGPVTLHLVYGYDAAGRRTRLTYPDGQHATWSYDPAGRLSTLLPVGQSTPEAVQYDGAGNLSSLTTSNGATQNWSYDVAGRLTGTTLFSQTATLDAAGQRVALDDTGGQSSFGYDAAGRLIRATYPTGSSEQDQYDAAGNRLVITTTTPLSGTNVTQNQYDAADELLSSTNTLAGLTSYSYDGNGNQTHSSGPDGATTLNTVNALNQLVSVTGPNGTASYVYDGQGDRLRSDDVVPGAPGGTLLNLAQDLAAFQGGGALSGDSASSGGLSSLVSDGTQDYSYLSPGSGQAPVTGYTPATAQNAQLTTDLQGSVRLVLNGAGQVTGAASYDAWGSAQPTTPDANGQALLMGLQTATPFGYAGQVYDTVPSTYDLRARSYSPAQGQFLSVDPLLAQTQQPYLYAGDNPVDNSDPSGLSSLARVPAGDLDPLTLHTIRQALIDAFVRADPTHASSGVNDLGASQGGQDQPYALARLVSLDRGTDTGTTTTYRGAVYYLGADTSLSDSPQLQLPASGLFDYSRDLEALQAQAATRGLVVGRRSCRPTTVTLQYGTVYPYPLSVAPAQLTPSAQGYPQQLQRVTVGPYQVYARLVGKGFVAYRVCQPTDLQPEVPCFGYTGPSTASLTEAGLHTLGIVDTLATGGSVGAFIQCARHGAEPVCLLTSAGGVVLAVLPPCHVPGGTTLCAAGSRVVARASAAVLETVVRPLVERAVQTTVGAAGRRGGTGGAGHAERPARRPQGAAVADV